MPHNIDMALNNDHRRAPLVKRIFHFLKNFFINGVIYSMQRSFYIINYANRANFTTLLRRKICNVIFYITDYPTITPRYDRFQAFRT